MEERTTQRFAVFLAEQYCATLNNINKLHVNEFENYLTKHSKKTVKLFRVNGTNSILQVYEENTFDTSLEDETIQLIWNDDRTDIQIAYGGELTGLFHFSKGLTVSI